MKKPKATQPLRAGVGRKLRLEIDPSVTGRICALLSTGCSVKTACEATGFSESTFFDYLRRSAPDHPGYEPRFLAFSAAISRARGEGKARLIGLVAEAARTDWRAAIALLERTAPNEYGRTARENEPGLQTPAAPIVHVTIQRDKASDEARKRFGEPPPGRRRCGVIGEGNVTLNST